MAMTVQRLVLLIGITLILVSAILLLIDRV